METRMGELRWKEVINLSDGTRYGYVGDAGVDTDTGQIKTLIVPGRLRLFGLLGREEDMMFDWSAVQRIGEDVLLVNSAPIRQPRGG